MILKNKLQFKQRNESWKDYLFYRMFSYIKLFYKCINWYNLAVMIAKEYCIAFCEGYLYAQLGEKLTNGKVTEHTLDLAKETAQTCIEQQIR